MIKQELITLFSDGQLVTGDNMAELINSMKSVQSAVNDPSVSGTSVAFIATISQNAEGKITATKKSVNFGGYQPISGMGIYQANDVQQEGEVTVGAGDTQYVEHKMGHYPTVRLFDSSGVEVKSTEYAVMHTDRDNLSVTLGSGLTDSYRYILD